MENDVVRPFGDETMVDIWLQGRFRAITVTKNAIEIYLRASNENAVALTPRDRQEFVRTHLRRVTGAAARQLRLNPEKTRITIDHGELHLAEPSVAG